jgi:hypothetical protein
MSPYASWNLIPSLYSGAIWLRDYLVETMGFYVLLGLNIPFFNLLCCSLLWLFFVLLLQARFACRQGRVYSSDWNHDRGLGMRWLCLGDMEVWVSRWKEFLLSDPSIPFFMPFSMPLPPLTSHTLFRTNWQRHLKPVAWQWSIQL